MTHSRQHASTNLAPDPSDVDRLLAGVNHNPHSILGAHEYGDETVIRTYRPHAVEVVALVGKKRFPLQHVEGGLFAAALPFVNLVDYRLEISYHGGDDGPCCSSASVHGLVRVFVSPLISTTSSGATAEAV